MDHVGICGPDVAGLSSVTLDCAALGQVCNLALTCQDSLIEPTDERGLGPSSRFANADDELLFVGNDLSITSSRRLTKLEADLVLDAPSQLTWLVFEFDGVAFHQLLSDTTSADAGDGFYASNSIDVRLESGKCYAIGVGAPLHIDYYDLPLPLPPKLSFAYPRGVADGSRIAGTYALYPAPGVTHRLRFTTSAP